MEFKSLRNIESSFRQIRLFGIVFMIIGIIGYFTIPTVAGWIIQAGGMGSYGRNVNQTAGRAGSMAGSVAGAAAGNVVGRAGKLLK